MKKEKEEMSKPNLMIVVPRMPGRVERESKSFYAVSRPYDRHSAIRVPAVCSQKSKCIKLIKLKRKENTIFMNLHK